MNKTSRVENKSPIKTSTRQAPKFGVLAGINGVIIYFLGSIPAIAIIGLLSSMDHSRRVVDEPELTLQEVINANLESSWTIVLALSLQCAFFMFYLFLVSKIKGSGSIRQDVGLYFSRYSFLYFFLGVALQIVGLLLASVFVVLKDDDLPQQAVGESLRNSFGIWQILFILSVAVVVPIVEEICFRGLLIRSLGRKLKPTASILISSIIFAVIHLGDINTLYGLTQFLLVAITAGVLFVYRGKLDGAIFVHMGFNSFAVFLMFAI